MCAEGVTDDETLFRRVSNRPDFFKHIDGRLRLSSSAFNDKARKPSVDRARLLNSDPLAAMTNADQGIVGLLTADVRRINDVVQRNFAGAVIQAYRVDVAADPLDDRPAHALIVSDPALETNRSFERLQDSLARLAERGGWLVKPMSAREAG